MFEISVKTHFSSAHHVRGHAGKCATPHGHNWDVEVFFRGDFLTEMGMLEDFRILKEGVGRILSRVDHKDLNTLPDFATLNPTSENIARWLFEECARAMNHARYRVQCVRVQEGPGTMAAYMESV
jgi:6-pyruvoyltetrahydropterin/6-carboxytetrahydropterin synthase